MPRLRAAYRPANPPPTTTTRCGSEGVMLGAAMDLPNLPGVGDSPHSQRVIGQLWEAPCHHTHTEQAKDPTRDDGELRGRQRRDRGGLDVAEARPAGDDEGMDRHHPAAQ